MEFHQIITMKNTIKKLNGQNRNKNKKRGKHEKQ
jgi:hypothetical protein